MKKLLVFLFALFSISMESKGDTLSLVNQNWDFQLGSPSDTIQWGNSSDEDSLGNLIVVGNKVVSGQATNIYVARIQPSGSVSWEATYNYDNNPDVGLIVKTLNGGYVYVVGASKSSTTGYDIVLLKYNLSGTLQWSYRYNGPDNLDDYPTGLVLDNSTGNAFITGVTKRASGTLDITTMKINNDGTASWSQTYDYNGFDDVSSGLGIDGNGNVYVGGGSKNSNTNREMLILKYSSTGSLLANDRKSTTATSLDMISSIAVASSYLYVTGVISGDGANYNYYTIKYSTSLAEVWHAEYDRESLYDESRFVNIGPSGEAFVTGYTTRADGTTSVTMLEYSSAGSAGWTTSYNITKAQGTIKPVAVALDGYSATYIAATVSGTSKTDMVAFKCDGQGVLRWEKYYDEPNGGGSIPLSV